MIVCEILQNFKIWAGRNLYRAKPALTLGLGFYDLKQRILRIYFTRIHFLVIGYEIIGLYSFNQVIELSIFQYSVKNYNIQQQLP